MRGFYSFFGYAGADIPGEISTGEQSFELGDTTYTVELRDSTGAPGEAQTQAREMAQNVDILAGGTSSASAIAIANNVAKRANVPYMAGPAASVSLTGSSDNCGATVFRASETVAMDAQSGGKYIANETDIGSVYIYYADYSFGQSVFNNYKRVLEANGVTVEGSQALPQGYSADWPGQFENATSAGVDAVIGGFTVATLPAMLGTYLANDYDFRFAGGWGTKISGGALGAALQQALDELTTESIDQAGLGPLTTRYHWNQYDNDINTEANQVHRDAYGTNADLFTSGMFTAASAIDQAVSQAGSANGDDIREALKGMTVTTTMKGEDGYKFQDWNNQARSAMTVADPIPTENTEFWDAPIQPGQPKQTYGMDETTQPKEQQSCDLS
jgi:branched-chain amino acid transport system substrate-binding protein